MLGTNELPLRVAVIGSGPSGFYAAEELLQSGRVVEVTMIERLPNPFGLVRSGVAPDHPKLKQPMFLYDRIARSPGFHFIGNVEVGRDVAIEDVRKAHHAVIFAYGADTDRRLGIPGEELQGSHSATEFVGWYNGHPDYRERHFDLTHKVVVIIGQGNVALDLARILAKPVDLLRTTDIAEYATNELVASKVTDIHIMGRRGPAQASFTAQELNELNAIPGCEIVVNPSELELGDASRIEVSDKMNRNSLKNMEIFARAASSTTRRENRRIYFHFFSAPKTVLGTSRVKGVRFAKTHLEGLPFNQIPVETEDFVDFPCGLMFRSIGYRASAIEGVPFDQTLGVLRNKDGRLIGEQKQPLYGQYATGWVKRGSTGIIGTNRADSVATVATLIADMERFEPLSKSGASGLKDLLTSSGKRSVSYQEWLRIDAAEIEKGKAGGKPREKFTSVQSMLDICEESSVN